jgi:NADH:ubiquinone oxidoreductase subunit F (NADH-binding)/(2Fe-2S) ferredoxin/Pyruvate/2-oxoacid:ferredoxin oxidoreductase delta subunit
MPELRSVTDLDKYREKLVAERDPNQVYIAVCGGTGCHAMDSDKLVKTFAEEIDRQGVQNKILIRQTGCHGFCEHGPVVVIFPEEICYLRVGPEDVPEIISQTVLGGALVERLLYKDMQTGKPVVHENEIPFYKNQERIILGNNRLVDPQNIDSYIVLGGYSALAKALFKMTPEDILKLIKDSNLRGRGGGGFPTWQKWETTKKAPGDGKYVIVNADEGDPGAFMNRSLLEGNPHSVLEGLIIGAYTIGAHEGFVYVRQEYPIAVRNLSVAIEQARKAGLLGKNILGSGFDFDVRIHRGAGAFVSGESSALMNAIEGKVGEPRPKYIHTAVSGVHGKPSNLNNVETWANVPAIINHGAEWYKSLGSRDSKGTKIYALVGKVNNSGLVEVPLGTSLKDIIYEIGGGVPQGKKLKAVQIGGPSGGCLPESMLDIPVDFDELSKVGVMMGSGGMIVMDEDTCMVDVARYFTNFLSQESCGKCIPCREGLKQMLNILDNICSGKGKSEDIALLEEIAETMREASLCALGTTAANPVLSTLKYFKDEYRQHVEDKQCGAGVCKELISYYIDPEKCQACLICARKCPVGAIAGNKETVHIIDQDKCTRCGTCLEECPPRFKAITKVPRNRLPEAVPAGTKIIRGKR